ncbi:MAG: DNA-3-methyladenine glycosylase [Vulcanimicrobiaceae bacterium]
MPAETVALARSLIGMTLVSDSAEGRTAVRIVETEGYLPGDAAAHSYRGETARNRSLFARAGHAYVYFIYGMYYCVNVSSETAGVGAGVLLRAGEPIGGLELMHARRPRARPLDLCRGPGKLATALAISRLHDGLDLTAPGPLWLAAGERPAAAIASSARIGITRETDRVLRFFERDSAFVSGPKRLNAPVP